MKLSNEAKIGLLATSVIIAVFFGFKYLKNENVFETTMTLYGDFDDAQQITLSSPVFFRGAQIGTLKEINFPTDGNQKVSLAMRLKQNPGIPKNAKLYLFTNGVLGGKALEIVFDNPCKGGDCAKNNDHLQSVVKSTLASFVGTPDEVDPYMKKVSAGLNGIVNDLSDNLKKPDNEVGKSLRDIQATLQSLRQTTAQLNKVLAASSGALNGTLKNVDNITRNLAENNNQINSILANANTLTQKANVLDFAKLNATTDGINKNLANLNNTLDEAQNTLKSLTGTLKRVQDGEGTLGKFVNNDSVYYNLNLTLLHSEALLQDLRLNPKRYLNLNPFRRYKTYVVPKNDPLLDTLQNRYNSLNKIKN